MSPSSHHHPRSSSFLSTIVALLGVVVLFFGLFFLYFGVELIQAGGSWYYVLCGVPLTLSGLFLIRGHLAGVWLYFFAWVATIPWTIYEVGFDWWGWLPRLFGPTLILLLVFFSIPVIKRQGR